MSRKGSIVAATLALGVAAIIFQFRPSRVSEAPASAEAGLRIAGDSMESPAAPPVGEAELGKGESWSDRLGGSEDLLSIVKDAVGPALLGDSEAQVTIGRAFSACRVSIALANASDKEGASPNPQGIPIGVASRAKRQRDRCLGLVREKSIQGFPTGREAYEEMYWFRIADKQGQPLGVAFVALEQAAQLAGRRNLESSDKFGIEEMSNDLERRLNAIVRSGDPRTLPVLAGVLNTLLDVESPLGTPAGDTAIRAAAWTLLACRQVDCLDASLSSMWAPCPPQEGTGCDGVAAIASEMRRRLGVEQFSRAEVLSYEMQAALERGAWDDFDLSISTRNTRL